MPVCSYDSHGLGKRTDRVAGWTELGLHWEAFLGSAVGGGPIPGRFLCHRGSRGDDWLSGLWTQLLQMGSTMGRTWEEPFQILHWSSRQVPVYRQPQCVLGLLM